MQLEGQIGEIDVIERLVELWRERFTGAFRFEQDGVIKIIYFKAGDVLSASTNDRTDSIDEILLRAGKVTREHVKQALAKRKESETLGDALLNLGFITRKELTWARRVQVIGIIRSIRSWETGSFTGVADYLPKREEGTLFPLPQILLELIVTDTDRARFEKAMDGGSAVFDKTGEFDEAYARLGLNQDADEIVNEIDGFKTASDVVTASGKDAFNVYKLLEALRALGLISRIERARGVAEVSLDDFASAGVADASDAWAAGSTSAPHFDLDEQPAIELPPPATPVMPPPPPAPEPEWASAPQWESEAQIAAETPRPIDVPLTAPAPPPPLQPEEPEWGFDEAQIETARRAAVPMRASEPVPPPMKETVKKASKPGRAFGIVITLIVIVILAFGGYAGWQWWQARNAPAPAAVVVKHPAKKPVAAPPIVASTVTTSTTATTATSAPPPAAPLHVTATTASVAPPTPQPVKTQPVATQQPSHPVTQQPISTDALRAKYDSMARDAAANTSGAYTVQFELVCETASVTRALRDGGSNVWITAKPYKGRSCYRVFWGRYGTAAEAEQAMATIPAGLREGSKPTVVRIPR